MNTSLEVSRMQKDQWVRSNTGMIAGVCEGLARRFGVDPWLVRIAWLLSILALGTGLFLYLVLAFCLPREDRALEAHDKRFLGVCARISKSTDFDVGLIRTGAVLLAFASFGATIVGYFVLHFILQDDSRPVVS
jgi:phage shock protein C